MFPYLNNILGVLIFFAIGFAGYFIFDKLRIPTPAILGPMVSMGLASVLGLNLDLPSLLSPSLSMLLGILLGLRFNVKIKGMGLIILVVSLWITFITFVGTFSLILLGTDKFTALFSATPGGVTEMAIVSMSFDSDTFGVIILQTSRLFLCIASIPFIARYLDKRKTLEAGPVAVPEAAPDIAPAAAPEAAPAALPQRRNLPIGVEWFFLIAIAALASWLAALIKIPAPQLVGAMALIGAYVRIRKLEIKVNDKLTLIIQIGIGGLVGLSISRESIMALPSFILPIIVLNVFLLGSCVLMAFGLKKIFRWDYLTCLLALAPGGMTPMIVLAMDMGADFRRVAILQVLRLVMVILLTPLAASLLL